MQIARIGTTKDRLGEAVLWDGPSQRLYWADATNGIVHRLDPATGVVEDFQAPAPLGALFVTEGGRLLLAHGHGTQYFDPATGALEDHAALTDADATVRLNDGKIDRQGRMVVGSLYLAYKTDDRYRAKFYTLGPDRLFRAFDDGVGITNGPCFNPDGSILYIADTVKRIVWAYDYDIETGTPSNRRVFADDTVLQGLPDGGTVDSEGHVWFAIMTASTLVRLAPDGQLSARIDMPFNPTSVAFGGPALETLYVTSLSQSVNVEVTAAEAGGLFAITGLGIAGIEDVRFKDR